MVSLPKAIIQELLTGDNPTRIGLREVNIWPDTIQVWLKQGYPTREGVRENGQVSAEPMNWRDHFQYDMVVVGGEFDIIPRRDYREVLEETEAWIIARDGAGAVFKKWKHKSGTPEHIDFRMTSRAIWERDYRPHLLAVDRDRVDLARPFPA
jgi:hypothetical protein